MKKIRRWLLMFAVIIALMVRVDGLKATSLTRRGATAATTTTSTTTTSTTPSSASTEKPLEDDETEAKEIEENVVTKPPLTGIPQIDYVWDPNLPRELNGYNLSMYPFLDSVPAEEDIGFTCDPKLHDGFYSSIKFNCQLYHHCIHGIRYDFLCANFTAFDQKTFICQFASEVDCKNSHKYWFKNEPLYKATTTSTTTTTTTTPPPTAAPRPERPLRRPMRRRRPPVDDYYEDDYYDDDDYFEERNRRRKNRPRNRKPIYDDDYDDDERFDRRPLNNDRDRDRIRERDRDADDEEFERRPYNRKKGNNRNNNDDERRIADDRRPVKDRRPVDDDRRRYNGDRRRPSNDERRRPVNEAPVEDRRRPSLDDRAPIAEERRRPVKDDAASEERRRPVKDDVVSEERRRPVKEEDDRRRPIKDDVVEERRRPVKEEDDRRRPSNDDRRSFSDDDRRYDDRKRGSNYDQRDNEFNRPAKKEEPVVTVRPSGSGIYDRPRAAPKIARPVPLNEKNKYAYSKSEENSKKPAIITAPKADEPDDVEYYEEYEDVPKKDEKRKADDSQAPLPEVVSVVDDTKSKKDDKNLDSDVVYYDDIIIPKEDLKPKKGASFQDRYNTRQTSAPGSSPRQNEKVALSKFPKRPAAPIKIEYEDEEEEEDIKPVVKTNILPREKLSSSAFYNNFKNKQVPVDNRKSPPASYESKEEVVEEKIINNVRPTSKTVKRPFLPSRGGNPYLARGLKPVGIARELEPESTTQPIPVKSAPFKVELDSSIQKSAPLESRTTNRPENDYVKSTLDQIYDEYDVTLNDALNPTLKPLTQNSPIGFSVPASRNRYLQQDDNPFIPFDPSYSSTEPRRTAIRSPAAATQPRIAISSRYDYTDSDYEY